MNDRTFRTLELQYRQHPERIFASVASLLEVAQLIGQGSTKLKGLISEKAPVLFTEEAALSFIRLFTRATSFGSKQMDRVAAVANGTIGSALAEWANESLPNSVEFYRRLLRGVSHESTPPLVPIDSPAFNLAMLMLVQHNPLALLPGANPKMPCASMRMLYGGAFRGSEEACHLLHDIWQLMMPWGIAPEDVAQKGRVKAEYYWIPPKFGLPQFIEWQKQYERTQFRDCGFDALIKKAEPKTPEILSLIESLWDKILTTARRGIRSDGSDTFHIAGPWERFGYGYRYFAPDEQNSLTHVMLGSSWPCQGTSIWVPLYFALDFKEMFVSKGSWGLLSYLAVLIAYQQILCREPEERSPRRDSAPRMRTDITYEVILSQVREYERRLPPGQQRDEARADYFRRKYGRELDEGKTFVYEHTRAWAPGDRLISGVRGMPKPSFSVNMEATIEKL